MPTKKRAKRPAIKSTKASAKKRLVISKFKFNKLGVAAIAAVLAVAGTVYVFTSHAASSCYLSNGEWQCFSDSAGITHDAGAGHAHPINIFTPSLGYVSRTVWYDGGGTGLYSWRGPGLTLYATNIKVCWLYVPYTYTATARPARVIFSVTKNNGRVVLWSSGIKNVSSDPRTLHDGKYYYTLQQKCQAYVHIGGVANDFEIRVQDVSSSDSYINIYKTTWQILD